jgi:hypothetical protein
MRVCGNGPATDREQEEDMNPLAKILITAVGLGMLGMACADEKAEIARATQTPAPHSALLDSNLYSFADIANLPAGAEHRLLTGDTFRAVPEMTVTELAGARGAMPAAQAGVHVAGSPAGSVLTLNGAGGDLPVGAGADDFSASGQRAVNPQAGANSLFSTAEIPEPASWMMLLCGLVVVGFMARRKG